MRLFKPAENCRKKMIRTIYSGDWDTNRVFAEEDEVGVGNFEFGNKIPQFINQQSEETMSDIQSAIEKVLTDLGHSVRFGKRLAAGAYGAAYGAAVGRTTKQWVIKIVGLPNETAAKGFKREVHVQAQLAEFDAAPKVYGGWIISGRHRLDYDDVGACAPLYHA